MPKYEIFQQDMVKYRETYEAESPADAWKQFHADIDNNRLWPIDSDVLYSEIEEVSGDA